MSHNQSKQGFPHIAYEADDLNKIIAPDSSVFDHERSLISRALGTTDERQYPFTALDNIGRVIRAFETSDRIFFSNENEKLDYFQNCPRDIAQKANRLIRKAISDLYHGQLSVKELLWLMSNLNSIQVITSGNNIIKIIFLMNDYSIKEFFESDKNIKLAGKSHLN